MLGNRCERHCGDRGSMSGDALAVRGSMSGGGYTSKPGPVTTCRARRSVSGSSSDARCSSSCDVTSLSAVTPKCRAAFVCVCACVRTCAWGTMGTDM